MINDLLSCIHYIQQQEFVIRERMGVTTEPIWKAVNELQKEE
jgi:hypothetical protein